MVWGCMMKGKKGLLVVLEYPGGRGGGMNARRYQEQVLEGKLLEFYQEMDSERGDIKFQHDGAPSHTAKSTKKWLSDHGIPLFPHPPSSPDLNPIEPVWHKLKHGVQARPCHPTSVLSLIDAVKEVWEGITVETIDNADAVANVIFDELFKSFITMITRTAVTVEPTDSGDSTQTAPVTSSSQNPPSTNPQSQPQNQPPPAQTMPSTQSTQTQQSPSPATSGNPSLSNPSTIIPLVPPVQTHLFLTLPPRGHCEPPTIFHCDY
ncbi:hypothetical protein D9758_018521 [Tetrapyrgos nigripes]|uniref:Tc1-like transposase DDE domain-containing protein n=1 Tax=Tetrapyrgos nigripes TaxID=182062 RepID=A0A8H5BAT8_9AGAR|nr:hypothetical protein D9758_018521 [Tetrapyrgos nigripes]